jgi:hypothetical protein
MLLGDELGCQGESHVLLAHSAILIGKFVVHLAIFDKDFSWKILIMVCAPHAII